MQDQSPFGAAAPAQSAEDSGLVDQGPTQAAGQDAATGDAGLDAGVPNPDHTLEYAEPSVPPAEQYPAAEQPVVPTYDPANDMPQWDANANGIPGEYGDGPDLDGNGNGISNEYGDGPDLDGNGVPDEIGINPDAPISQTSGDVPADSYWGRSDNVWITDEDIGRETEDLDDFDEVQDSLGDVADGDVDEVRDALGEVIGKEEAEQFLGDITGGDLEGAQDILQGIGNLDLDQARELFGEDLGKVEELLGGDFDNLTGIPGANVIAEGLLSGDADKVA